jgi:hypothetical protein
MTLVWSIAGLFGAALWTYGYFVVGHPPVIDWAGTTPWWIADFIPNMEAEIGLALSCLALIPIVRPG